MIVQAVLDQISISLAVVVGVLAIVRLIVIAILQRWREISALTLAPRVYEAGGDAADVLRALANESRSTILNRRGSAIGSRRLHESAAEGNRTSADPQPPSFG